MIQIPVYSTKARLQAAAVLVMITLAIAAALDFSGLLVPYSLKTMDLMFRRLPLPPASPDVALIAIDQADIDFFKDQGVGWPWPRELYAPIIDFCRRGGAKAVIFDMLYTESSVYGQDDDQKFARSMREAGQVILPFFLSRRPKEPEPGTTEVLHKSSLTITGPPPAFAGGYLSILPPIPPLLSAARGLGNVESSPDSDGTFQAIAAGGSLSGPVAAHAGFCGLPTFPAGRTLGVSGRRPGPGIFPGAPGSSGPFPAEISRTQP